MRKKIILLIIVLLLSIFMVGAVNASSNDSMVSSSKVTNSISSISDTGDVDISNVKNSGVKEANNILKKVNSKKRAVSNINHSKSETTSSSKSESYKDAYDDYEDEDIDGYEDYIDGYDDDYEYELVHDAYLKSKKVYYGVNTSINFGWNGNFEGYFKVYKGKKQVYSYYIDGYNGRYTYNPHRLGVGEYTTKLISDGKTIAKGKIVVNKVPSKISVNSFKIYSGIKFNYYVYVFNKDNTYLNEGYVKFEINGKTYKAKVKKGEAKIRIKVPTKTGTYMCKAKYYGGKNSENSKKVKFKMVVKKKPKNMIIYNDWCHGSGPKHKATWTKKHDGNAYIGIVYKNGHKYKKYIKLYTFICVCGKNKNHKPWLESHDGEKYYSYESYGTDTPEKYIYKKIW